MDGSLTGVLARAIISVLTTGGYFGLLGLMAAESACLPLPSEIILPFAGFLVFRGQMDLVTAATIGAAGCNLGSAAAYAAGRHGGRTAVERWGRYVLLTRDDLRRADWFFHRFGDLAVLIARMLPVVRTFIALPAGISHMPLVRFHVYTFVGSWPWCFLLIYVGMVLGDKWSSDATLHTAFHFFDYGIAVLAALFVMRFVWSRWRNRRDH